MLVIGSYDLCHGNFVRVLHGCSTSRVLEYTVESLCCDEHNPRFSENLLTVLINFGEKSAV